LKPKKSDAGLSAAWFVPPDEASVTGYLITLPPNFTTSVTEPAVVRFAKRPSAITERINLFQELRSTFAG
jgi:hypothetical protein